jgi:hypothetical protein
MLVQYNPYLLISNFMEAFVWTTVIYPNQTVDHYGINDTEIVDNELVLGNPYQDSLLLISLESIIELDESEFVSESIFWNDGYWDI